MALNVFLLIYLLIYVLLHAQMFCFLLTMKVRKYSASSEVFMIVFIESVYTHS